jgi:hypothetical protein
LGGAQFQITVNFLVCRGNTEREINRTVMINRETIYKISAYLDSKRLSANKFGFQNLIKIEGGSF